jgi:hypothetical protein
MWFTRARTFALLLVCSIVAGATAEDASPTPAPSSDEVDAAGVDNGESDGISEVASTYYTKEEWEKKGSKRNNKKVPAKGSEAEKEGNRKRGSTAFRDAIGVMWEEYDTMAGAQVRDRDRPCTGNDNQDGENISHTYREGDARSHLPNREPVPLHVALRSLLSTFTYRLLFTRIQTPFEEYGEPLMELADAALDDDLLFEDAVAIYERLLKDHSDSVLLFGGLYKIHAYAKDWPNALGAANRWLQIAPKSKDAEKSRAAASKSLRTSPTKVRMEL